MELLFGPRTGPVGGPVDDDEVLDLYPWPESGTWVRAMMVTTLDGATAGPDGLSGSISSDDDRAVFNAVRRLADAVLVGAGTARAEGYQGMKAKPADAERREQLGKQPAPRLAIVSGKLDLDWGSKMFTESTLKPLVLTGSEADPDEIEKGREHAEIVVCDGEHVAADDAVKALEERGLRHIVCEGGPTLLAGLASSGRLDEADITLSPRFAGTEKTPQTPVLDDPAELRLVHTLHANGYLMNRYVTIPSSDAETS